MSYEKGPVLTMLEDYNIFPVDGMHMPSKPIPRQTMYERTDAADGDDMYVISNRPGQFSCQIKFSS